MTHGLFLYGTLCHRPLLDLVLGASAPDATIEPAVLPDHAVFWAKDQAFPMIAVQPGSAAQGVLVGGLTDQALARLDFYEGGFAYALRPVTVRTADGKDASARVYFPQPGRWEQGAVWSLEDWQAQWGGMTLYAAEAVMARFGHQSAEQVQALLPFLRARGWARELAAGGAPTDLRRAAEPGAINFETVPGAGYDGFFGLRVFDISHRRFDDGWSDRVRRECFVAYDAALVLPYDPVNDLVLLVEQLRYGPILRGDPAPWVLEPVAGLVDAGESPADAARREAMEESGLVLGELIPMMKGYGSPGYSSEHFHCFLALCDLGGVSGGLGGLASEQEDIRSHVLPFNEAMDLLDRGEITAIPLASMLLWLARWRQRPPARGDQS